MKRFLNILANPLTVIFLVLLFDQWLKIWVKTNMYLSQEFPIFGNWFYIHFTENKGMAFGMEFGGDWGKLALSLFRIIAVFGIGYYLFKMAKNAHKGFRICVALIFAGAIGNIIDKTFKSHCEKGGMIIFSSHYNPKIDGIEEINLENYANN